MKKFSDFGIKTSVQNFVGDSIKVSRILNRDIVVHDFKIEDSKFGVGKKCLYVQISVGELKHVVFSGSVALAEMIQQVPKEDFPFETKIIKEDERYIFA